MNTQTIYNEIMASEVFRLNGPKIDLPDRLFDLAKAIRAEAETDWTLGEFTEAPLDSLVIGAYWSLTEWHGGQASDEYAALCQLGMIYSPGMTDGPEEGSCEEIAYEQVNKWFEARNKGKAVAA